MPPLIYLPAYNCAKTIAPTIREISEPIAQNSQLLVVDNASADGTAAVAADFLKNSPWQGRATVLRATRNLGYAGSQKLAFRFARSQPDIPFLVMLHADGQYPPRFLPDFFSKFLRTYQWSCSHTLLTRKFSPKLSLPLLNQYLLKLSLG